MDLWGRVRESSIDTVLIAIKQSPFYHEIKHLILAFNHFGNVLVPESLRLLPPNLKTLDLSHNEFDGQFVWSLLPKHLEHLFLQNNHLRGTLDCYSLPKNLQVLAMQGNAFQGVIEWEILPKSMEMILATDSIAESSANSKPADWDHEKPKPYFYRHPKKEMKIGINHNANKVDKDYRFPVDE